MMTLREVETLARRAMKADLRYLMKLARQARRVGDRAGEERELKQAANVWARLVMREMRVPLRRKGRR